MCQLGLWEMDPYREKVLLYGESSMQTNELIALLLEQKDGLTQEEAAAMAETLMDVYGDATTMRRTSVTELATRKGMNLSLACTLAAALELGARSQAPRPSRFFVMGAQAVFEFYSPILSHLTHERFHVMCLDSRHLLIRDVLVSVGGASSCMLEPREALVEAVRLQCQSVIFVHNHPSGDPEPSPNDMGTTRRLKRACEILGIEALDHVIIGDGKWVSFVSRGIFAGL